MLQADGRFRVSGTQSHRGKLKPKLLLVLLGLMEW
jgi:hypothetical protein